ncbi:MAG: ABC transporter permease [Pseudochelatococcus sp.]|jgi:glycine betaine/proline transport system permease protein|uniref:ABC transporter permease n=1 Tax=Pseudochelatococcus sp. TaxID=2020869 RepID=UPI003D8C8895
MATPLPEAAVPDDNAIAGGLFDAIQTASLKLTTLLNLAPDGSLPLAGWINQFVRGWLVPNFRPTFRAMQWPVAQVLNWFEAALQAIPVSVFIALSAILIWRCVSRGMMIFTALSLGLIAWLNIWAPTMTTLAMVLTAVFFCALIGIPLGILAARSDRFSEILRPTLDVMQTIPSFVYLVPIVMLFGVGLVPGVIATIVFALPPVTRLTNLGIRQVDRELVEAAYAFGSTRLQVLTEVQLPQATRTIMAGMNQTLMMSLSMVVVAAMIGAGGLGLTVYTGLGRLDVGAATVGGIGIVLIAIILDRFTQALADPKTHRKGTWTFRGCLQRLFAPQAREAGASAP